VTTAAMSAAAIAAQPERWPELPAIHVSYSE
jgi:hypothetical protein